MPRSSGFNICVARATLLLLWPYTLAFACVIGFNNNIIRRIPILMIRLTVMPFEERLRLRHLMPSFSVLFSFLAEWILFYFILVLLNITYL